MDDRQRGRKEVRTVEHLEKTQELVRMIRQVTDVHSKILAMKREYFPGEWYYLGETHFIKEIGVGNKLTMTEAAKRMGVTAGAVAQMAKRLEEKGCVQRISSKEDRRINEIQLTEKGEQLYYRHQEFDRGQYCALIRSLPDYTEEELDFLIQFEENIRDAFERFVKKRKNIDK